MQACDREISADAHDFWRSGRRADQATGTEYRLMSFFLSRSLSANYLQTWFVLLISAAPQQAQPSSVLQGSVKDSSGLAIPKAQVAILQGSRPLTQVAANDAGEFLLNTGATGKLTLRAAAPGFTDSSLDLQLSPGETRGFTLTLTPSRVSQSVTVSGSADSYAVESDNTATRMGIPLMNLPQSVAIVTKSVIADQAVLNVSEALRNVAGARQTGTYFGTYDRINLRGFDQSQTNTYYRNGARFVMLSNVNAASIEQVEVLKGPAAIAFGQIPPGGAINLVSKRPSEDRRGEIMFRRGSFNSTDGIADFTGPLSKRRGLFYRVNFYGRRADSFRDLVNNDQFLLNPSLTWRPTNNTTLRLEGEYDRFFSLIDLGIPAPDGRTLATAERLPISRFLGEREGDFRSHKRFWAADLDHALSSNWRVRGVYNFHYMHRDVKQIAGVSMAPDQATLNRRTNAFLQHYYNYFVQGDVLGNFELGPTRHTFSVGADSLLGRWNGTRNSLSTAAPINVFNPVYGGPLRFAYGLNFPSKNKQLGYYVQDQISFKNGLQFLVGARYNGVEDFEARTRDRDVSPRLGVVYRPQSWISIYGSFSQSFEAVNGFDFRNARFLPSLGRQSEFGVKNRWFGDKLSTTAAWFRLRRSNVLTPDPNNVGFSIQTGLQQSQGLELEAQGAIRSGWRVIASFTYLDTSVLRDNVIPAGNRFAGAPRHSGSLWSNHAFRGRLRNLSAGWGLFYTGAVFGNIQNAYQVPAYTTADAQISYRLWERSRLQFNAKNLFNDRYYIAASNLLGIFPGAPRSFAISLTTRF
jgi:iron complex outermembrane recepter protein